MGNENSLPTEEELVRLTRDAILEVEGVEAAGDFDAWVAHMKREHPERPLFVAIRRPTMYFSVSSNDSIEPTAKPIPTEHQRKLEELWKRFRANVDAYGFEHAPVAGEEGWHEFWKEAIEQRSMPGFEKALEKIDVQWRERSESTDPYKLVEQEIENLAGKPPETHYSDEERQRWNSLLDGIDGL